MSVRERAAAVGLLVALSASARAQTILGTVVDASERPVGGVVVFMLDSTSAVVARALSTESGAFRVAAPRAGSYRLRTMRIGYRPTTTEPIPLLLGGEVTRRVSLTGALVALDTVRIVDRNSCRVAADSGFATFAILDQARTALAAAQLTAAGKTVNATTLSYERTLEPDGRRVLKQSSTLRTDYVTQPWRGITPESARRNGFVSVANDRTTTYFAPSIDILLSNAFVEDHCFRMAGDRRDQTLVGVAFEPTPERKKLPEIRGTLWLDRKTAELRRLDYRYVNVSREEEVAGGDVAFARLTDGGWVISRWNIRMPLLEEVVRTQALGGNAVRLTGLQVSGGEVVLVTRATAIGRDTLWSRPALVLAGVVIDSASGTPIANAAVSLMGANAGATTDSRGRYSIAGVLPGTYLVETRTPELDAIGSVNQSTLTFDDSTASYRIRVPSAAQLTASICAARALGPSDAAIVGRVFQKGDTIPAANARVTAEWTDIAVRDEHGVTVQRTGRRLEGRTAVDGVYRLCGVPRGTTITLGASMGAVRSEVRNLRSDGVITRADLLVDRALPQTATFAGTVLVDSAKTPIAGAEVYFPDLSRVARTGNDGVFSVAEIPPGDHHVIVRRLGFAPLDTTLSFARSATMDRQVYLARVAILDSVLVTEAERDRALEVGMRDFEEHRRLGFGHFFTRAELAKMEDRPIASVLGQTPGLNIVRGHGSHAWAAGRSGSLNNYPGVSRADSINGATLQCYVQVYIDGMQVYSPKSGASRPLFDLSRVLVSDLEGIEFYSGAGQTPMRYQNLDAQCGVLVLHTRRTP